MIFKVLDPGHCYEIPDRPVDKKTVPGTAQRIHFVKRDCETSPKAPADEHSGLLTQDLIRVCIDRMRHIGAEQGCKETDETIKGLQWALYNLEKRAWARHALGIDGKRGQHSHIVPPFTPETVEALPLNAEGHVIAEMTDDL